MKKVRKVLALGIAAVMSMALFASCGGGETEATASMYVSVCNSYVADESLQAFSDELFAAHPDWAEGETLSYEMVDTDGNPTGEWTPACGVKISSPALDAIYGSGEYGIFIVGSTTHLDQAKEVFLALTAQ